MVQLHALESSSQTETFLDRMLGTNCYTKALEDLEKDCKSINQEQKSRFALYLANCQLATQGQDTYPCGLREPLRTCLSRLPDRETMLYIEFLTHADTMCLFLQNRDFEKYTENMLNTLAQGAGYAKDQLSHIGIHAEKLAVDTAAIRETSQKAAETLNQHTEMHKIFMNQLQSHHDESNTQLSRISTLQSSALQLAEDSLHASQRLEVSQESMNTKIQDGQSRIGALFSMLDEKATALSAAQSSTISAQHALSTQLQALVNGSQTLHRTIDAVAEYQRRSDAALITLLGKSYRLEDAVFYVLGSFVAFVAGSIPSLHHARLPIFCLMAISLLMERYFLEKLHSYLDIDPVSGNIMFSIPVVSSWWLFGWHAIRGVHFSNVNINVDDGGDRTLSFYSFDFKWAVRRSILSAALIIVVYTYWSYVDYEKQSNILLQEMRDSQRRQEELLLEYRQELYASRLKELSKHSQEDMRIVMGRGKEAQNCGIEQPIEQQPVEYQRPQSLPPPEQPVQRVSAVKEREGVAGEGNSARSRRSKDSESAVAKQSTGPSRKNKKDGHEILSRPKRIKK